ncbi:MAG TPA: porphobilinogen synthase [Solirubrobacteraceae bacterium]
MAFPQTRMRRLRSSASLRGLVRETELRAGQLVLPLFVSEDGSGDGTPAHPNLAHPDPTHPASPTREPIATDQNPAPPFERLSISALLDEAREVAALGLAGVMLFGIPAAKDAEGSGAWDEEGVIQTAVRALKRALPEMLVLTDVCLCEYTDHGHCGVLKDLDSHPPGGSLASADLSPIVDNDATLELLARVAVSHARAGADLVAPSDMMDGRVGAIRGALDEEGFADTPILAYSAKFASAFYGPFRDAAGSAPARGDRRGYQMDPANGREAVREALLDVEEGADMVMVKPALAYGDLIRAVKRATRLPVAAYNVSGEYAMVKAAAAAGYLDERAAVLEILTSLRRAGADTIISYHSKDAAQWLAEQS